MIKVKEFISEGVVIGLEITGHANSAEKGKDLVCAGVSSIVIGGFNSLNKEDIEEISLEEGYAKVILKNTNVESINYLKVIDIQLRTIEESYPKYIKIK